MLTSTSRLPFPPTVALAVIALVGLALGLILISHNLPDLTLFNDLDRPTNARLAYDLLVRQTGQPPPSGFTFRLLQLDRPSLAALRGNRPEAPVHRLARQASLPLVIDHIVWFRPDGKLAAQIGLSGTGELVGYYNAEVPAATHEWSVETAVSKARAFLGVAGVKTAWLGEPQVEQAPGQADTEVRWQQPLAEAPTLTRVMIVRLRGDRVWYFQHRLQPTTGERTDPLDLSATLPFFAFPLQIGLLAAALAYLLKTARRHVILWRVPTVAAAVVGVGWLLAAVSSLPYALNEALFADPVADGSPPPPAKALQNPQFLALTVGGYAATNLGIAVLAMGVVWAACAALQHIEYEVQRPYTQFFRAIMLLRRVPYAATLERSLVGSGVGWALLGLNGVCFWLAADFGAGIEPNGKQLTLLLDAWSPGWLMLGTMVLSTFEQGIVLTAFVWLAPAHWLCLSPWRAWIAAAVIGSLGFSLGWHDPFALLTSPSLSTPWLWARDVAAAFVLTATFERFGLWATLCALWVYQATGMAVIVAALPAAGVSPWLPTLLVLLPLTVVVLAWRPAENERDVQPTLLDRIIEEQRQARQLAMAARIQASFLPTRFPQLDGWDIAAATLPAREVGGDFYDFFQGSDHTLGIFVGDVSGKSVSGALFTVVALTAFRSEAEEDQLECAAMLARLNELLYPDMKRVRMFVAAAYVQLDLVGGHFTVANAGLPAPAYRRVGALSGESAVTFLEVGGLPLGSFRRTTYEEQRAVLHLESRDCLVLTSDGIVEALNEQGTAYGYEALAAVIDRHADHGAHALCEAIVADVKRHIGDAEPSDDMTVFVIQRRPTAPSPVAENGQAHTTSRSASSSAEN